MLGVELFQDLPEPELRRLVAIAKRRRFARGEVVFHRGDPADTLHLIARGRFIARVETGTGDIVAVSVHGSGDAFGELALLGLEQHRSATVAAPAVEALAESESAVADFCETSHARVDKTSVSRAAVLRT